VTIGGAVSIFEWLLEERPKGSIFWGNTLFSRPPVRSALKGLWPAPQVFRLAHKGFNANKGASFLLKKKE
jgi:hypothetical protein